MIAFELTLRNNSERSLFHIDVKHCSDVALPRFAVKAGLKTNDLFCTHGRREGDKGPNSPGF